MKYNFRKVSLDDIELVYKWLEEQHVREFWDNSQAHRDDIKVFAEGRK
ncbi:MAG: GNAT family N-acetyltransferase, partial [Coxiella sp. (in: Bacteria)]